MTKNTLIKQLNFSPFNIKKIFIFAGLCFFLVFPFYLARKALFSSFFDFDQVKVLAVSNLPISEPESYRTDGPSTVQEDLLTDPNPGEIYLLYGFFQNIFGVSDVDFFSKEETSKWNIFFFRLLPFIAFLFCCSLFFFITLFLTSNITVASIAYFIPLFSLNITTHATQIKPQIFELLGFLLVTALLLCSVRYLRYWKRFIYSSLVTIFCFSFFRFSLYFINIPVLLFCYLHYACKAPFIKSKLFWRTLVYGIILIGIPLVFWLSIKLDAGEIINLPWMSNWYLKNLTLSQIRALFYHEFVTKEGVMALLSLCINLWLYMKYRRETVFLIFNFLWLTLLLQLIASFFYLYPFSIQERFSLIPHSMIYLNFIISLGYFVNKIYLNEGIKKTILIWFFVFFLDQYSFPYSPNIKNCIDYFKTLQKDHQIYFIRNHEQFDLYWSVFLRYSGKQNKENLYWFFSRDDLILKLRKMNLNKNSKIIFIDDTKLDSLLGSKKEGESIQKVYGDLKQEFSNFQIELLNESCQP